VSTASGRPRLVRLAAAAVLLPLVPAVAPANAAEPTARDRAYDNPLAPTVPGDGTVDSCADPTVLRGQQPGDPYWYMYCTTDPLNDAGVTGSDEAVFHRVPMMRSRNLVDWRYLGDAISAPPEWAADTASLWAPDVAYSQATGRYYLTFVVTDVGDEVSGEPGCADDNAIGVAVSPGPLGPWHVSDEPVVGPRRNPDGGTGCDPDDFFPTLDPDVLGDTVGRDGVLYYGSYFGGVHATRVAGPDCAISGSRSRHQRLPVYRPADRTYVRPAA
jgi:arabinan endo-1,5-alpha-L-arabinosidase